MTRRQLRETPIINSILGVAQDIKESELGDKVGRARDSIADKKEELREKWETSQHPYEPCPARPRHGTQSCHSLVYQASGIVDSVFSETEDARAYREVRMIDSTFDPYHFVQEMRDVIVPAVRATAGNCVNRALTSPAACESMAARRSAHAQELVHRRRHVSNQCCTESP